MFGGLSLASTDICDFRANGQRMRIDDFSAPNGTHVGRGYAFVVRDHRLGRSPFGPDTNAIFTPVFAVLFGATPPELPLPASTPPSETSLALAPSARIPTRTHRRATATTGAAQPTVGYGIEPGSLPRSSSSRIDPPPRVPRPRSPLAVAPSHLESQRLSR